MDNLYQDIRKVMVEGIDNGIKFCLCFLGEREADILTHQFEAISHDMAYQRI
jgi:hypothetical protein